MGKLICPNCQSAMTFFQFAKAPTPWHLLCPQCGVSLKANKYLGRTNALIIIICLNVALLCEILDLSVYQLIAVTILTMLFVEIILYLSYRILRVEFTIKE